MYFSPLRLSNQRVFFLTSFLFLIITGKECKSLGSLYSLKNNQISNGELKSWH